MAESGGLFVNDFETGDMTQWTSLNQEGSNTFTAAGAAKNNGSYGGLLTFDGTNNDLWAIKDLASPETELYWRAYFYFPSGLSWGVDQYPTVFVLYDGAAQVLRLRLYCNGTDIKYNRLYYYDNAGSQLIGLTADVLPRDTWIRIEMHYKAAAGTGEVELWIDGVSKGSASALTNDNYAPDACRIGTDAVIFDSADVFYVDDCKAATTGPIGAYSAAGLSIPVAMLQHDHFGGGQL